MLIRVYMICKTRPAEHACTVIYDNIILYLCRFVCPVRTASRSVRRSVGRVHAFHTNDQMKTIHRKLIMIFHPTPFVLRFPVYIAPAAYQFECVRWVLYTTTYVGSRYLYNGSSSCQHIILYTYDVNKLYDIS